MEDVILLQNKKFFIVGKLVPESGIQIKDGQKANSKSVVVIYQNYLKFIELESEDRKHKKMVVLSKEINPHGNVAAIKKKLSFNSVDLCKEVAEFLVDSSNEIK